MCIRDRIKTVPEVASVYGKAGRAETATDPAPMEMFETTIPVSYTHLTLPTIYSV